MSAINKFELMRNYLNKLQGLFYKFYEYSELPIMDNSLEVIDDIPEDYYGHNLTGKHKMIMLFYTGQSNHFPGILIGEHDYENCLDQLPIYIMDLSSDDIGNV